MSNYAAKMHPRCRQAEPAGTGFLRPIVEIVFAELLLAEAIVHKPFVIEKFIYEQPDTKIPIPGLADAGDQTEP